jgi:hypothetical protein
MGTKMDHLRGIARIVVDARHWLLLVLPFIVMYFIDPPTTKALAFSILAILAMMGVMLIGRKIVLPYFDSREYLELVRNGNIAAAIVVVGVFGFMALTLIGVVWWVRG